MRILDELEHGGTADVPELGETLPTPIGQGSGEAADERALAISAERTERRERAARAAARGQRPKQWPSGKPPRHGH